MNHELTTHIISESYYLETHQLTDSDYMGILDQYEAALRTTNGDTGPVTITARQAILLLRAAAILSLVK